MSENQEQNQQEGGKKVQKAFEQNMAKLTAVLSGDNSIFKQKVPNDKVQDIVDKLLEKRTKGAAEKLMTNLEGILDKKVEFDQFVKKAQKDMEKAIEEKMKEFNGQIEGCFKDIENINTLTQAYRATLTNAPEGEQQEQAN